MFIRVNFYSIIVKYVRLKSRLSCKYIFAHLPRIAFIFTLLVFPVS